MVVSRAAACGLPVLCLGDSHYPSIHDPLLCTRCQNGTADHDHESDGTLGNVEELSLEVGEAERGDDEVGKHTEAANDEDRGQLKHHVASDDGVRYSLKHLRYL